MALALVVAACTTGRADNSSSLPSTSTATPTTIPISVECARNGETTPWADDAAVTLEVVQQSSASAPGVALGLYPRPEYEAKLWSAWGQGIVTGDGRFFSSLGDENGVDGNSFIYEYNPGTMTLTQVVDVLAVVPHQEGDWGFGKIHAQMVDGPCNDIYVSTYWGSRKGLTFTDGYQGDLLLRLDPVGRSIENLGVILAGHGVASLASSPDLGLIYAEAADPFGEKTGSFVVVDATTGDVDFTDDDDSHGGYRNIAVGADGSAFVTWDGTGLARYDPVTNTLTPTEINLPGSILRASTPPDAAGRVYAVSRDPARFFALDPDGTVVDIGPARGYTTTMALSPGGDRFYYVPDAHGGAWEQGTPVIAVDTKTGEEDVIVELNPLVEKHLGLRAGGTYSIVVSPNGNTLYVVLNAGNADTGDSFGEVVLAVVTLP